MKRGQAARQCFPGWLKTWGSTANPGSSQPDTGLKVSPCCQPGIDTRQSGGVNTRDLWSLAVSFFIWFQSLHKIVHFDGLKRFVVRGRPSWRGFNLAAVAFPSLCGQIQKVDEEVKECFGVARRRWDCTCPGNTICKFLFSCELSFVCGEHSRMCLFVSGSAQPWFLGDALTGASDCLGKRRSGWQNNVVSLSSQWGHYVTVCNVCVFRSVNKLFGFCQWTPRYRLTSPRVAWALWLKVWTAEPWEKHCSGTAGCLEVVCKKKLK